MTEVEFHTGVADPVAFACRLLRKAAHQGERVQVTAPPAVLSQLDRSLWTLEAQGFVPHVRMPGAPAAVAGRTPIWLTAAVLQDNAPRVLMNLGADRPAQTDTLDRVIEIVSGEDAAAASGRERWRAYKSLGLAPKHHADPGPPHG